MNTSINHPGVGYATEAYLYAGLAQLSAYIDLETDTLETLLIRTEQKTALDDLQGLHALHLGAETTLPDVHQLLLHAQSAIASLLDSVVAIPFSDQGDAALRWSGARLQDILTALSCALTGWQFGQPVSRVSSVSQSSVLRII